MLRLEGQRSGSCNAILMMDAPTAALTTPETAEFYRQVLATLQASHVPFLVGGAYAFQYYAGVSRSTKDFDIFVRPHDLEPVLDVLEHAGLRTEVTFEHWLAKAFSGDRFIDVIFNSGNGVAQVDDEWFIHAVEENILGGSCRLTPAEEMIWSKAFIMERERFDGADIAHLFRHASGMLDWDRLGHRFGPNYRVLLAHMILFGFIYPGERTILPSHVMRELLERVQAEMEKPTRDPRVCQGTLLSREQYLVDIDQWGYEDARLDPRGTMTADQISHWTAAISDD